MIASPFYRSSSNIDVDRGSVIISTVNVLQPITVKADA